MRASARLLLYTFAAIHRDKVEGGGSWTHAPARKERQQRSRTKLRVAKLPWETGKYKFQLCKGCIEYGTPTGFSCGRGMPFTQGSFATLGFAMEHRWRSCEPSSEHRPRAQPCFMHSPPPDFANPLGRLLLSHVRCFHKFPVSFSQDYAKSSQFQLFSALTGPISRSMKSAQVRGGGARTPAEGVCLRFSGAWVFRFSGKGIFHS